MSNEAVRVYDPKEIARLKDAALLHYSKALQLWQIQNGLGVPENITITREHFELFGSPKILLGSRVICND